MPIIGEIKKGRDIGRRSTWNKFIWHACEGCGKQRWVMLTRSTPTHSLCSLCFYKNNRGIHSTHWKGGRVKAGSKGKYTAVKLHPDDFYFPMANLHGYVYEHRLVLAKHLNRCLLFWEVVHHRNGIKNDNRLENLLLLPNRSYHISDIRLRRRINELEKRVTLLEAENVLLKAQLGNMSVIKRR